MIDTTSLQKISNEETAKLPAINFKGRIVIVDNEDDIEAACLDLAPYSII